MGYFTSLISAFRAVQSNSRLVGVRCVFGHRREQGPSAGPLMHWVPTRDRVQAIEGGPVALQAAIGGAQVEVFSPAMIAEGADVRIIASGAGEGAYEAHKALRDRIWCALYEELDSDANYRVGEGYWPQEDAALSTGALVYVLPIAVLVPVLDLIGTAEIATVEAPDIQPHDDE